MCHADLETCRRNILSEDYRDFIENRTRIHLFLMNFSFKIPVNRMPVVDTPAIIFQKNP